MARLVRRQPLLARIKSYLNPLDFLLWLSEEIDSNDWDQFHRTWATPVGLILNMTFLIARSNSGQGHSLRGKDDVFGDDAPGSGYMPWFWSTVTSILTALSVVNASYTFYRKRHYRLFETSVDAPPSTPSAQRVRVDSSPMSSSPLRFVSKLIESVTAEARSHPDASRDVWEIAVWDPLPLGLRLFCLFSPGHVLVYYLFLPTAQLDPRPSITIFTTILLGVLLSVQLSFLQAYHDQHGRDIAVIHKEVLHEYNVKYVTPRTNAPVRDVGTQYKSNHARADENTVDTYTPTTIINRAFKTYPNPSYVRHVDPDGVSDGRQDMTPVHNSRRTTAVSQTSGIDRDISLTPQRSVMRQPQFRPIAGNGDGGSLGVYSHANSPLRKASSANQLRQQIAANGQDRGHHTKQAKNPTKGEGSPLKRSSVSGGGLAGLIHERKFADAGTGIGRRGSGYI